MPNTYYLDLINGNDAANGLSFANRRKTIAVTTGALLPGDIVLVMESQPPTNTGVNSTWTSKSAAVTVASPFNVDISQGSSGWTGKGTITQDTADFKLGGTNTSSVVFSSSVVMFTDHPLFTKNLPVQLNLAGYTQVSFWIKNLQAIGSGQMSLQLCTNTAGLSPIYTITVPAIASVNQWVPIVVNLGVSMVGNIKSIAIKCIGSLTTITTFKIDNIVACLPPGANCITHQTLIGKPNSTGLGRGMETWYALSGITPTALYIDNGSNSRPVNQQGYYGTTETVQLCTRMPIAGGSVQNIKDALNFIRQSGTNVSPITWQFGMNTDGMILQTGETWITGQSGYGTGLKMNCNFVHISGLACVRFNFGLWLADCHGCIISLSAASHCETANVLFTGTSTANTLHVGHIVNCSYSGFTDRPNGGRNDLQFDHVHGNSGFGVEISNNDLLHDSLIQYNSRAAYLTCGPVRIYRCRTDDNSHPLNSGTSAPGLYATYFNGTDFDLESYVSNTYTQIDPNLNFFWTVNQIPAPGILSQVSSVIWEGYITATTTELYTFTLVVDDGARIWLDDVQVISAWYYQNSGQHTFTSPMTTNVPRKIRVEYFNITIQGVMELSWASPTIPSQIIPASAFTYGNGMEGALMFDVGHSAGCEVNMHDCIISESLEFAGIPSFFDARVRSHNHDAVKGSHLMVTDGGRVVNETGANRHTLSGFAWNLMPSSPRSALYPLDYKLASLAVVPNKIVTAKCYFKRTDANVTGQLLVLGGQLDGVPNDVIATSVTTGQWEQLTVTFTPTEIGVIDIYARVFGGSSSSVFVDDMSVSQS